MLYTWLKVVHIAADIVWMGGMVLLAWTLSARRSQSSDTPLITVQGVEAVIRWDRMVTAPAMGVAWVSGIIIALMWGWFTEPWLLLKLMLVLVLSAMHGALSGRLRRVPDAPDRALPNALRYAQPALLAGIVAVVALVVTKPF